jgi:hypothetical protein
MPTPFQILADPVSLAIMAMYLVLMVWEAFFPARRLPPIPFWRAKRIVAFFFFFFLSTYVPLFYAHWLPSTQLIDLTTMNVALAGHQMHHSAERFMFRNGNFIFRHRNHL